MSSEHIEHSRLFVILDNRFDVSAVSWFDVSTTLCRAHRLIHTTLSHAISRTYSSIFLKMYKSATRFSYKVTLCNSPQIIVELELPVES